MTPESQRIAIAEACGWKRITEESLVLGIRRAVWMKPGHEQDHGFTPPDYLEDLNAMHEAEKVLNYKQVREFDKQLHKVMHLFDWQNGGSNCANYAWHATASQRAEAFLRTRNLWK